MPARKVIVQKGVPCQMTATSTDQMRQVDVAQEQDRRVDQAQLHERF